MDQLHTLAVNARFLLAGKLEGIGRFTEECLKRMVANHPECKFYFLFDRPYHTSFVYGPNVVPVVLSPPARHPFLWYWWFEFSVAAWLNKNKPQVFLSPDGFGSMSTDVPQTIVFHDLAFEHYPDQIPALAGWFYRRYTPRYVAKSKVICSVSMATAKDLELCYKADSGKVRVVPNAAGDLFHPLSEAVKKTVKEKHSGGCGYLLYVGALHPRKNILGILEAFYKYKSAYNNDKKLLLAGRLAWKSGEIEKALQSHRYKADIILKGHTQPQELASLMAAADILLYPSFFEGFGIPILEAMKSGTPVITSNCSSMPEVAGDAALLINPADSSQMADAIHQLLSDKNLRTGLIEKGLVQSKKYNWEDSSRLLWSACCDAANS